MVTERSRDPLYFAYGSNLCLERFLQRVPSGRTVGIGFLAGRALRFHKVGSDGSGKADAWRSGDPADVVWGVLYDLDPADRPALDRAEGLGHGYRVQVATVSRPDGTGTEAWFYEAERRRCDQHLTPWDWYLRLCVVGASSQGLPTEYVAQVGMQISRPDPDRERATANLAVLRDAP